MISHVIVEEEFLQRIPIGRWYDPNILIAFGWFKPDRGAIAISVSITTKCGEFLLH
jgi:hypothetical protein